MNYGALYNIESQLNEKGYTLGDNKEIIEKIHYGLNLCHIHGILTSKEWDNGLKRLNKMVGEYAKLINEKQDEPEINPCLGCEDYKPVGGCKSKGGCADIRGEQDG